MIETDITKLAYEKITDKYYKAKYLGMECIMDTSNGYINGTNFCSSARDKTKILSNYINRARYKLLVTYYMSNITEYSRELSIKVTEGIKEIRGTYLHPILFLDLAIWISPTAYMKATKIITNALIKDEDSEDRLFCLEQKLEVALKRREDAERRAEEVMVRIILQNEKTHSKLENEHSSSVDSEFKIKLSLKRVETRVEKIAELIHTSPIVKSSWTSCFRRNSSS